MEKNIRRRSKRMLGLDIETKMTPPLSPYDLPSTKKMNEKLHSDIDIFPPFESQVEVFETLEEGYLQPSNPPLTEMSILVISEFPT